MSIKKTALFSSVLLAVVATLVFFLLSKPRELPADEYAGWLNDPEHGLLKETFVHGLHISVKYLPTDYLVHSELSKQKQIYSNTALTAAIVDSIRIAYEQSMTFVLSIQPDSRKEAGGDVMFRDISSYSEFVQRALTLNFAMEKAVSLRVGSVEYAPVLSNLENTYGLENGRNIVLVFPRPSAVAISEGAGYEIVWNDMLYTTGIHRFFFSSSDLATIPLLSFEQIL